MIRYVLTLLVCCVSVVGEAQMRSLRLNYKPLMDTIVMDKEDTLIYEVKGLKQPTFADTVPNYCKPYIYTLIFRGMYDKLVYTPTMTFRQSEMTKLDSLREMVRRPLDTDIALGYAPFDVLCYRYMIDNPSDVKYAWQAIPDVEDRIKNRRKRNHEQEDYNELLKCLIFKRQMFQCANVQNQRNHHGLFRVKRMYSSHNFTLTNIGQRVVRVQ